MRKTILYLLFCCAIVIAYMMGSLNAHEELGVKQVVEQVAANKEFSLRVERYQPSCDQLKQLGRSSVRHQGDDLFVVYTTQDYFYVVGVRLSPEQEPFTFWWGGDRATALSQCVDR